MDADHCRSHPRESAFIGGSAPRRYEARSLYLVKSYVRKQATRDFARFEVFFSDRPRSLTVPAVVAVDRVDRGNGRVAGREAKEPFARWENVAEPGVLGNYGLSTGEIVGVAFAEPAAAQPDILVLG